MDFYCFSEIPNNVYQLQEEIKISISSNKCWSTYLGECPKRGFLSRQKANITKCIHMLLYINLFGFVLMELDFVLFSLIFHSPGNVNSGQYPYAVKSDVIMLTQCICKRPCAWGKFLFIFNVKLIIFDFSSLEDCPFFLRNFHSNAHGQNFWDSSYHSSPSRDGHQGMKKFPQKSWLFWGVGWGTITSYPKIWMLF